MHNWRALVSRRRMAIGSRIALVTGAASGLGRAAATRFAAAGARVVLVDLPSPGLDEAVESIQKVAKSAENVIAAGTDVTSEDQVR
jgi:NAD(P)-dependent dehydrogenase (short-subunit alcohol dehydrogenase family)